jgi:F0F1-type ATP synthase assembly protein I
MITWAGIVLGLSVLGIIVHIIAGTSPVLLWNDIILGLLAIGILYRISYKIKQGEKEELEQKIQEITGTSE